MSMSNSTRSAGDVDLERLARAVDQVERGDDHVLGLLDEAQAAAVALGPAVDHVVGHDLAVLGRGADAAEDDVRAASHRVRGDLERLLAEPLGGEGDRGQAGDVVAEAAGRRDVGEDREDARVVHARAHVQHRRDADGLADLGERVAGELHRLGREQAVLAARDRGAAGDDDEHVVGDELAHDVDDCVVLHRAWTRAADDRRDAADACR